MKNGKVLVSTRWGTKVLDIDDDWMMINYYIFKRFVKNSWILIPYFIICKLIDLWGLIVNRCRRIVGK